MKKVEKVEAFAMEDELKVIKDEPSGRQEVERDPVRIDEQ